MFVDIALSGDCLLCIRYHTLKPVGCSYATVVLSVVDNVLNITLRLPHLHTPLHPPCHHDLDAYYAFVLVACAAKAC